jgi:hypothetical protein
MYEAFVCDLKILLLLFDHYDTASSVNAQDPPILDCAKVPNFDHDGRVPAERDRLATGARSGSIRLQRPGTLFDQTRETILLERGGELRLLFVPTEQLLSFLCIR